MPAATAEAVHHAKDAAPVTESGAAELGLEPQVICPHCWHASAPHELLWISEHHELLGDPVLGAEVQARFRASRFTVDCKALDARGMPCARLACPRCHLPIPRALVERTPIFVSIIGVPASGKSYFLTSMSWQLRQQLPGRFATSFLDADPQSNASLIDAEQTLFMPDEPTRIVALRKTDVHGDHYSRVRLGEHVMQLPRPFLFMMKPGAAHPNVQIADVERLLHRVICFYDNAGEHYQPGMETSGSPVTQHLSRARLLMFLFDPTQDPRFRARLNLTDSSAASGGGTSRVQRQEVLLTEAAVRVRRSVGLPDGAQDNRPLIVIVPKLDVWESLLPEPIGGEPFVADAAAQGIDGIDLDRIERVSAMVRRMLLEICPEAVDAAEQLSSRVTYVPLSAVGTRPLRDDETDLLGFRPADIRPRWVTVPLLYALARHGRGLIGGVRETRDASGGSAGDNASGGTRKVATFSAADSAAAITLEANDPPAKP